MTRLDAVLARELAFVSVYILGSTTMTDRQIIVPDSMKLLCERAGHAPAVKVGYRVGNFQNSVPVRLITDFELCFARHFHCLR